MRREEQAVSWLLDPQRTKRYESELVRLLRTNFPWAEFCDAVLDQRIAEFMLFQIRRHELVDLLPPWAYLRLRDRYDWTAMRNGVRLRDLTQLAGELTRQRVRWVPTGETLLVASGVYPDRGLRELSSLTLAIASASEMDARKTISRLGYRAIEAQRGYEWVNERGTGLQIVCDTRACNLSHREQLRNAAGLAQRSLRQGNLTAFVDLWALTTTLSSSHAMQLSTPRLPVKLIRKSLRRRPDAPSVFRRLVNGYGKLFPTRAEMLRRHGRGAVGFGLYKLYASRLFASTSAGLGPAARNIEIQAPKR